MCGHAPRVSALSARTGACSCFILPCPSYPPLAFKKPVVLSSWLRATCTWVWCHRTTVCAFFVTVRAAVIAILAHICIPAVRFCCRPAVCSREERGLKMLCLLQEGGVAAKCSRWAPLNRTLALLFPVRFCVLPIEHACTCFHEVNANTAAVILAQGLLAVIQRSVRTFTIDSSNGCENSPALDGEHREGSRKRGEVESMPGIRRVLARSAVSLSGTRGQVGWNRMRCRHDAER